MSVNLPFSAVLALVLLAAFVVLWIGLKIGVLIGRHHAEKSFASQLESERANAIKRSRAVLGGQFSEQLSPYLPGFPADPTEVRFIGKPVDFISFAGVSRGVIDEIVFIEVKTGGAKLTPVERSLRDAIRDGKIRYVEYHADRPACVDRPAVERPDRSPDRADT